VAAALEKLFKNDKDMRRREFEGFVIWESVPPSKDDVPTVTLDLPSIDGGKIERKKERHEDSLLPNQALTSAYGHLMIASHYDFLVKVLQKKPERETLRHSIEYQLVDKASAQLGIDPKCARNFVRTDEAYRPTYELTRQGKMPESETMLARAMNTFFGPGKKGSVRKQEIDGRQMPDFEKIRRYLGPAGLVVKSEDKGWFFKGVLLPKGAP
jgi:hypothetical protein